MSRSDRKHTIKPTIKKTIKNTIYRMSYITRIPIKEIAEQLCMNGINNHDIISKLSRYFKQDVRINNKLYMGSLETPSFPKRNPPGTCERITFRVTQPVFSVIEVLASALDCSLSKACAMVLEESVNDFEFIDQYFKHYLERHLDAPRMEMIENIMLFNNQREEEESTFASLIAHIVEEVREPFMTMKETVDLFLLRHWETVKEEAIHDKTNCYRNYNHSDILKRPL